MAQIVTLSWVDPSPTTNVDHIEIWRSISGGALAQIGTDLALGVQTLVDNNGGAGFADAIVIDYEGRIYNSLGGEIENTDYIVTDLQITIVDTADVTAPLLSTSTIEDAAPTNIVMVFNEAVTFTNLVANGFTIGGTTSTAFASISGSGATWTGVLGTAAANGESVTIAYSSATGDVADLAANDLATFTAVAVTNNVAAAAAEAGITFDGVDGVINTLFEAASTTTFEFEIASVNLGTPTATRVIANAGLSFQNTGWQIGWSNTIAGEMRFRKALDAQYIVNLLHFLR
jgi:hypothetical protein